MAALTRALVNIPLTGCRVCQASSVYVSQSRLNSNKTYITRTHRHTYLRTYPAILVKPDGSSIHIRYKEPRKLLQMPVDINTLTEEERQIRLARRKPKQKVKVMEDNIEDTFDNSQYQFMWKNKN